MQGLITLDFGNSHPHAGLFQKHHDQWNLIKVVPWNEAGLYLDQLGMNAGNSQIVLAQVKDREEELLPFLRQGYLVTRVKDYWRGERFAGMPVLYAKTLGEDRLIQAYSLFKKEKAPVLMIDAGTYVTVDVIHQGGFRGGYILPGQKVYLDCFTQGEQLKEMLKTIETSKAPSKQDIPHETKDAIKDGYIAFLYLVKELIIQHQIERVILTGGSSEIWEPLLTEAAIKVKTDLHHIHHSLHFWMTTQITPL
jgi:pantothenate kinase type III